jgi:glycosyltransferase involved in cell wall biosynthesis
VLDISRLLSRVLHATPTGIDRVEMAYARELMGQAPNRLSFGAVHPAGPYGRLTADTVERFLDLTQARWESGGASETPMAARLFAINALWRLYPRTVRRADRPRVLLQASPHHLDRPRTVAAKLAREGARFVCLVHDLIPISHPEYARPGDARRHCRRLQTLERHADALLVNSNATREALLMRSGAALAQRPIRVAHLGLDRRADATKPSSHDASIKPYFVCIGTIEPRKNHLLLLTVWRSIVEAIGAENAPKLLVIGRRGWENENVVDMLERSPWLRDVVHELPGVPDSDLRSIVQGARALLMPSFAEGFGLPVAEALDAGVPVLASDLPAHREAGGNVPEFLDPIDGVAWRDAVLAYTAPSSPRRIAQLERLETWRPVRWHDHIATALSLIEEVAACPTT